MAWTTFLILLLSHCIGSLSQPVLTQLPSLSVSPGASSKLTCTLSSGFSVGNYWISWYQQKPGSPPKYLLSYYSESSKNHGTGVPSRFSGSKDTSANAGVLQISGLQLEDEADYYCGTWHSNAVHSETGRWGRSLSQPVLTQLPSLSASPGASSKLTCTMSSGFSVGNYWISWYQQKPGSPPKYLLSYYSESSKNQGTGVPSRFSGSKDTSANAGVLQISGLQLEDEADYYCALWHSDAFHSETGRWGSWTKTNLPQTLTYSLMF
ncbi:immunoglobulin lambda-1 light chain-like [Ictidomys tridecemlineatus]|nr:immunoglobulin lambda-1 light chain-like [Ictidomys tridecemlineatus]